MTEEEDKAIKDCDSIFIYLDDAMSEDSANDYRKSYKILKNLIEKQSKEIEELKEDRKKYAEEYIHNNPWLYKQLNENYILKKESEQKERQAWIEGTNVADKLCNKKWEAKIKAKIEEVKDGTFDAKIVLQSLLEKE